MKPPLQIFMLGTLAITITFYGLSFYKQKMAKYRRDQILKKIQRAVELYYVDNQNLSVP